ncbi:hypothetical protein GCM10009804_32110 [Kribbella hippodromi]|uniref:Alkylmercury lyase n=1 Tax=Kribbella hippodromi TaxID=434347 RepID=A0ABN2DBZ8_9ACTN
MKLEVLHVPDCPNLAPLLTRLGELTDVPVTTREVRTDADAAAADMAGSPTLLVNGTDPFASAAGCTLSCRLYRDDSGRVVTIPTAAQLQTALAAAVDVRAGDGRFGGGSAPREVGDANRG